MESTNPYQNESLARMARQHFLQSLCTSIPELDRLVVKYFQSALGDNSLETRELPVPQWQQEYALHRRTWAQTLLAIWREAFVDPIATSKLRSVEDASIDELQLISDDAIEGLITSARVSMQVAEKVDPGFTELRKRLLRLDPDHRLDLRDPIRPTMVSENLVTAWQKAALSKKAFGWVMAGIAKEWGTLLLKAYQESNAFLAKHGIEPLQQSSAAAAAAEPAGRSPRPYPYPPDGAAHGMAVPMPGGVPLVAMGVPSGLAVPSSGLAVLSGMVPPPEMAAAAAPPPGFLAPQLLVPGAHMPMPVAMAGELKAPDAKFGRPVLQQVNALWHDMRARLAYVLGVGDAVADQAKAVDTVLERAMQAQQAKGGARLEEVAAQTAFAQSPHVGQQVADVVREQSQAIKEDASQANEKAIIEMVALMFQSVISEERVPALVRVLFARLQVPVLRIALADPTFFTNAEHPARALIDRMGSAAMGFDGAEFNGSALEVELRRIVQMIEQYPDTGIKVFELALSEFEAFLQKHLAQDHTAGKVVSLAQQVEEKETLLVKFTIELRKLLQDLDIREEVRAFLFRNWAEVLAVSAVRTSAKGPQTLRLKQTAALLVWATTAKTHARERRRAVQAMPGLLRRLREGLRLIGVVDMAQEALIGQAESWLHEAFLAKDQAGIPMERLKQVSARLENLENFISSEGVEDIPLSNDTIELMLGMQIPGLTVLQERDSSTPVSEEVIEWAKTRTVGEWFDLRLGAGELAQSLRVQYVWHSGQHHLQVLATQDGRSFLLKLRTLAAYFEQGALVPIDREGLMLRATRVALTQFQSLEGAGTMHVPMGSGA